MTILTQKRLVVAVALVGLVVVSAALGFTAGKVSSDVGHAVSDSLEHATFGIECYADHTGGPIYDTCVSLTEVVEMQLAAADVEPGQIYTVEENRSDGRDPVLVIHSNASVPIMRDYAGAAKVYDIWPYQATRRVVVYSNEARIPNTTKSGRWTASLNRSEAERLSQDEVAEQLYADLELTADFPEKYLRNHTEADA